MVIGLNLLSGFSYRNSDYLVACGNLANLLRIISNIDEANKYYEKIPDAKDKNRCKYCTGLSRRFQGGDYCEVCDNGGYNLSLNERFEKLLKCCHLSLVRKPSLSNCDSFFEAVRDQLQLKRWFKDWWSRYNLNRQITGTDIRDICADQMEKHFLKRYSDLISKYGYYDPKKYIANIRDTNSSYDFHGHLELVAINDWIKENVEYNEGEGVECEFMIYSPDSIKCARVQIALSQSDAIENLDFDRVIRLARDSETASRNARYASVHVINATLLSEKQKSLLFQGSISPLDDNEIAELDIRKKLKSLLIILSFIKLYHNAVRFSDFLIKIRDVKNANIGNFNFFLEYFAYYSRFLCSDPICYLVKEDKNNFCKRHQQGNFQLTMVKSLYEEIDECKMNKKNDFSVLSELRRRLFALLDRLSDDKHDEVRVAARKASCFSRLEEIMDVSDIRRDMFSPNGSFNRARKISIRDLRAWISNKAYQSRLHDTMEVETNESRTPSFAQNKYEVLRKFPDDPNDPLFSEHDFLLYTYFKVYTKADQKTEYICHGKIREVLENESYFESKYTFKTSDSDFKTLEKQSEIDAFKKEHFVNVDTGERDPGTSIDNNDKNDPVLAHDDSSSALDPLVDRITNVVGESLNATSFTFLDLDNASKASRDNMYELLKICIP